MVSAPAVKSWACANLGNGRAASAMPMSRAERRVTGNKMSNSTGPEGPSLAATMRFRPQCRTRLRLLVLMLGCTMLGACAARAPKAPPTPAPTPVGWQAAIGNLDVTGSPEVCTAVLVRSDMIATTSHCLRPKGRFAAPGQLVFTSSASPSLRAKGTAIVAEGGSVAPGNIKPTQAQTDWALV